MSTSASESTADPALASALLTQARATVDPILRDALSMLPSPLDVMAGNHFGWCDIDGAPMSSVSGKALRPAFMFAAARSVGRTPDVVAHAAAAVELLHNFSLVHDDIMDGDALRHGRATVWKTWGVTNATLVGDGLQALATRVLTAHAPAPVLAEAVRRLTITSVELCGGQYLDCAFEQRASVAIGDYLAMATGKTGALIGCACALGGLLAGADPSSVHALDAYGRMVGVAFQLVDDVIGIWGDPNNTGKPAGTDLVRRKRTFPVVRLLGSGLPQADQLATIYQGREPLSDAEVAAAIGLLDAAGGSAPTLRCAEDQITAAFDALPAHLRTDDLLALAQLAAHRDR
ncbi:polyprenyl synthetase family protein [Nocardia altamirensis]|uniref:polyprenyl synthetase family protein n=1 Tax=Nocardia altamirensis TaxID=472158 RepID=UPI00083FDE5D|nr:polyprenyl synthetase family protein [Nocardia altamirensis]